MSIKFREFTGAHTSDQIQGNQLSLDNRQIGIFDNINGQSALGVKSEQGNTIILSGAEEVDSVLNKFDNPLIFENQDSVIINDTDTTSITWRLSSQVCQKSKISRQGTSVTQQYYTRNLEGLADIESILAGSLNTAVTITSISFKNIPAPSDDQTWCIYIMAGPFISAASEDDSVQQTQHAWMVKCDVDKDKEYLRLIPRVSITLNTEPEPYSTEILLTTLVGAYIDSALLPDSNGGQNQDYDSIYIVLFSDSYRSSLMLDSFTSEAEYSDGMAYKGKRFVNYSDWNLISGIPEYLTGNTLVTDIGVWTPSMSSTYFTIDSSNTDAIYFRFGSTVFYYFSIKITAFTSPGSGINLSTVDISGLPYSVAIVKSNLAFGNCIYQTDAEDYHKYVGVYGLTGLTTAALSISDDMSNAISVRNWPNSAGTLIGKGYYFTDAT